MRTQFAAIRGVHLLTSTVGPADYVEIRNDVMMGKPCLKGTRIPVYLVLEKLAAGESSRDILDAYPQLTPEHIKASLEYAARLAADEIMLANQ